MGQSRSDKRRHSSKVVDGPGKSASRAMLRAVGFTDEDFRKPQVGIASTWSQVTPCNSHIGELAERACEGADDAGGKGVIFNTITISDQWHRGDEVFAGVPGGDRRLHRDGGRLRGV